MQKRASFKDYLEYNCFVVSTHNLYRRNIFTIV